PIDTAILESVDTLAIHSIAEGQTIPLAEDSASAESSEIIPSSTTSSKRGLGFWLLLLYLFGVAVLGVNLLFQIVGVLWKAYRNEDKIEDDGVVIVNIQGEAEPCSFFRYIFINPSLYDFDTYEQILTHERIHVEKGHSLDLLLAELAVVFLWFNPFVWILRKEVEKNLEYQTDHLLIANAEEVKESYQINLVKMATYTQPLNITTNYNQSLITQRILKMNTKKSNYFSYWKYAFLLPLLFIQLLLLNQPLAAKKPNESSARTNISDALRPNEMPITEIEPTESQITTPLQESGQTLTDTGQTSAYTLDLEQDASFVRDACGDLTRAIRAEDLAKVKELIQSTDVNCVDPDPGYEVTVENEHGWTMRRSYPRTPLGMAARVGNLEIARLLVDAGAKIDFRAGGDATPLMEAAYEGHLSFVEYLSEQGAAINLRGGPYGAALSSAAANGQAKVVEYLLDSGANINIPGGAYGSALSSAANDGHVETVKLLINRGADLNINDGAYGTALNTAANNGHTEVVRTLLAAGANINAK
ncbi:MAG: ankyrin repeat domain-containing protein, partial [Bacteroidota bacterium]